MPTCLRPTAVVSSSVPPEGHHLSGTLDSMILIERLPPSLWLQLQWRMCLISGLKGCDMIISKLQR